MKAILKLLIIVAVFFGMWFAISQINFMGKFELDHLSAKNEKRLGELIWEGISRTEREIKNDSVNYIANQIVKRICSANKIDVRKIKIHIIENEEVNAFTLPDRHLVINKGLLLYSDSPEEVAGVVAHEIAHMELDHVIKKLIKEVGLSMLFVIAGGNGNFEIIREVGHTLSSSAFDREQETEADLKAVQLLTKAHIDPSGLANFLFRLSKEDHDFSDEMVFISTHPGSAERSAEILKEKTKYKVKVRPFDFGDWQRIKDSEWEGY